MGEMRKKGKRLPEKERRKERRMGKKEGRGEILPHGI